MIRIVESVENVIDLGFQRPTPSSIKRGSQNLYDRVKDCENDGVVATGKYKFESGNEFDVIIEKKGNEFRFILEKDGITYVDFDLEDLVNMRSNSKEYLAITRLSKSKNPKPITDDALKNMETTGKVSKLKSTVTLDDIRGNDCIRKEDRDYAWIYFKNHLTKKDWENYGKWYIDYQSDTEEIKPHFVYGTGIVYGTDYDDYYTLYTGINEYTYKAGHSNMYLGGNDW